MIVSRTPLRISFFGGGSDYPGWYREHGGSVLSATIDKYTYLTVRRLPPFFEHKNRLVYRLIETTRTIAEIQHPTARVVLQRLELDGVEIHHDADLPARSGMGTSSAFTVGLLNACHALQGRRVSRADLANEALHIEQDILKETVGSQDQVAAAHGGLNRIDFGGRWPEFDVEPIPLSPARRALLHGSLLLFFTGVSRTASEVAGTFVPSIAQNPLLERARRDVDDGLRILAGSGPLAPFGELLHQAWINKRNLSPAISTPAIDVHYARAIEAGAIGGKLLGAGGGGFLLFFAPIERHAAIRAALGDLLHVPFAFESGGSKIIVYDP